jgi:hypothetical protein
VRTGDTAACVADDPGHDRAAARLNAVSSGRANV